MIQRHLEHRSEIRSGADGLGIHFRDHGKDLDLKIENIVEQHIMPHFELTIIGSVEPNKNYSQKSRQIAESEEKVM